MFHPADPNDTKPCWHMRTLVSCLADNQLTGIMRWLTRQHVNGCAQCQKGLATIHALRQRLQEIEQRAEAAALPAAHWESVETAWKQSDQ